MINKAIIEWNLGELRRDALCRRGPGPLASTVRRLPECGADIAKKVLLRQWHDGRDRPDGLAGHVRAVVGLSRRSFRCGFVLPNRSGNDGYLSTSDGAHPIVERQRR
jgi:hypothetical protein